jgi:hypothetical protein
MHGTGLHNNVARALTSTPPNPSPSPVTQESGLLVKLEESGLLTAVADKCASAFVCFGRA